tara:strand:+ start:3065 stop:3388 length:324 start_codon:yes stop_codon:yes gene_type:complete
MINTDSNEEIYFVLTTEENKKNAYKIANALLKDKLVACVTFKDIESFFWWEGKINKSKEVEIIMKCKRENIDEVCKKISIIHTYEVPEIIYFPGSVNKIYYQWMRSV